MEVTLVYYNKDGNKYKTSERITIKEARKYFKKVLKNNNEVSKVILTHFDGWHERLYETLKKEK